MLCYIKKTYEILMVSNIHGRFDINHLSFADDTALVADSEEKLYRLVSEFGRICERRMLRVNVGKMSCYEVLKVCKFG